jgi:hypothetical protein
MALSNKLPASASSMSTEPTLGCCGPQSLTKLNLNGFPYVFAQTSLVCLEDFMSLLVHGNVTRLSPFLGVVRRLWCNPRATGKLIGLPAALALYGSIACGVTASSAEPFGHLHIVAVPACILSAGRGGSRARAISNADQAGVDLDSAAIPAGAGELQRETVRVGRGSKPAQILYGIEDHACADRD